MLYAVVPPSSDTLGQVLWLDLYKTFPRHKGEQKAMTDSQKFKFYFPSWNRCAKANSWKMSKGRLVAEPQSNSLLPELSQVWTYARQIADREHRGIEPNDLRHGCHIVALRHDKSSEQLTNKEVNRVVALFDLLADPDDLAARIKWENPENSDKASLIAAIKARAPYAYVAAIAQDQCGTKDWESLQTWQLQNLLRTVNKRKPNFPRPQRPSFKPNGPIQKFQYIKKTTPAAPPKNDNEPF